MVLILTAVVTVTVIMTGYLLLSLVVHRAYQAPRTIEFRTPADYGIPYQTVTLPTENNKHLFAWYVPPTELSARAPAVVVIHGWGGNAEFMLPFATWLHRAGYATLLVDSRNHGMSDKDSFSSMPRFAEDLEHGFEWLITRPEVDPHQVALLGHSVGAGAALLVASRRRDVAAVVSIAAFAHPEELMHRQMQSHRIPYIPIGWTVLRYIERVIGMPYEAIAPVNTIRQVSCPVLLVHGCEDSRVPASDAEAIYAKRCDDRVKLLIMSAAGHSSSEHMESLRDELILFLKHTFRA